VHGILTKAGLTRYYDLRSGPGLPPADLESRRIDDKWLELIEETRAADDGVTRVELDIQGIHCAACVWLIEELFRRQGGARAGVMSINPALGRIDLRVVPDFRLSDWVDSVEDLGYLLGPARATGPRPSDDLLLRVGICAALAGNVMLFAAAIYLGLREGPVYELLNQLSYAAGVLALLIGGSVFVGSALRAIRQRVLHLDVPIALGIVLAFTGSTYSFFFASGHAAYIDTLTVFVALMLTGRWLQQRMLERTEFEANVLRHEGAPFFVVDGQVRNSLRIHLVNKTGEKQTFLVEPESESGIDYIVPQKRIELESLGSTYLPVLAVFPADQMRPGLNVQLTISMEGRDDDKSSRLVEAPFVGPLR
jgi:Cu2+-exporting ATPase